MKIRYTSLLITLLFSFFSNAQNMADYTNNWEGEITNPKAFNLTVEIENIGTENSRLKISNENSIIDFSFQSSNSNQFSIPFGENLRFEGTLSANKKEINGLIQSGLLLYHLKLKQSTKNSFKGVWNILMVDELKAQQIYLSLENGSDEEYEAYPIFSDDRFTGTWCGNFQKKNDHISFIDFKTGLQFQGHLLSEKIQLGIYLDNHLLTKVDLKKSTTDWKIGGINSDINKNSLSLTKMESQIASDSLINTHAVLVSQRGTIIYENYFNGYNAKIPHDMRSASKSISSAMVGIARDQSLFNSLDQSIFDFLPNNYQIYKDSASSQVDLKSLLTMSSGFDAVDFGTKRKSLASENNYQPTPDWTKTILEAPMIGEPNLHANYGSANPYLLGVAMDSMVNGSLALYIHQHLFEQLDITNYIIQTDMTGRPYFGGGMYLTPSDMLKFGELYLNQGIWNGKQIISKKWIKESFVNYNVLENTTDKNGYGYLWWHHSYEINGQTIQSIEARGAGGQYIFVLPELETVAVITSGNYRSIKNNQPELIFEQFILPNLKD